VSLLRSNSFDGGSDGVLISPANSGGASGDAFSAVAGTLPKFSNAQAHTPGLGMRIVDPASAALPHQVEWTGLGSLTTAVYLRWYVYLTGYPVTERAYMIDLRTAAAAQCGFLRLFVTSGFVSAADATNSGFGADGSVSPALNKWVRIEARIVPSTTAGELQWRLFNNPESGTPSDASASHTGLTLGANIDAVRFGITTGAAAPANPFTILFDDVAVGTGDWIGPTVAGPGTARNRSARMARSRYARSFDRRRRMLA
jgi:hypothetical protein